MNRDRKYENLKLAKYELKCDGIIFADKKDVEKYLKTNFNGDIRNTNQELEEKSELKATVQSLEEEMETVCSCIKLPFSLRIFKTEYFNRLCNNKIVDSFSYEELIKIIKQGRAELQKENNTNKLFGISIEKFDKYFASVYMSLTREQFNQLEKILQETDKRIAEIREKIQVIEDSYESENV